LAVSFIGDGNSSVGGKKRSAAKNFINTSAICDGNKADFSITSKLDMHVEHGNFNRVTSVILLWYLFLIRAFRIFHGQKVAQVSERVLVIER
jgi:hypothetical protein